MDGRLVPVIGEFLDDDAVLLDALEVWKLRIDYLVPLGLIVLGLGVLASAWPLRERRS